MKSTLWKRYLRTAQKVLILVKQHELQQADFDVAWLEETVQWMDEKQFVTDPQKVAIDNTMLAVRNMIRYRKLKERRKRS